MGILYFWWEKTEHAHSLAGLRKGLRVFKSSLDVETLSVSESVDGAVYTNTMFS